MTKLTELGIRRTPLRGSGQKIFWDDALPGFGIRVGARSKSFVVMSGSKGREFKTIGRYPAVSLSKARKEAILLLATKTMQNRSTSFLEASEAYIEECGERIRPATIRQYTRCLGYLDFKGDVRDITRANLAPILHHPHTTITFKTFFTWCIRNDLIDRNPLIGERIPVPNPRSRVLTPEEIKAVWHYDDAPFSDILKLLILTGQRRGEVPHFKITDVITIPAIVSKNKREHIFPYGELTKKYLKTYSFNGWSKSKARLDKAINIPHWTIHDLRRTFATIHAQLGTPIHITEKLLNHVSGSHGGIVGVYQQHAYMEEMKKAVETYEAHIATIVTA